MSHLPIFKKKSADYHRFFYLCLSLEIGEKNRLVGIRLYTCVHIRPGEQAMRVCACLLGLIHRRTQIMYRLAYTYSDNSNTVLLIYIVIIFYIVFVIWKVNYGRTFC